MSRVYIGSIVSLKSGGCLMTVQDYDFQTDTIDAYWFAGDKLRSGKLPAVILIDKIGNRITIPNDDLETDNLEHFSKSIGNLNKWLVDEYGEDALYVRGNIDRD